MMAEKNVAWITGASSGIGRAVALRLARDGWTVGASARSEDKLEALSDEARKKSFSGAIIPIPLDISDEAATRAGLEKLVAEAGPVDLAILNAGTYKPDSADDFSLDDFAATIDLNVKGTAVSINAVMPAMIARKGGHIAIVSSVAGYRGLPRSISYSSSKAALIAMAESLKFDLDRHNVKIQVINPGFVRTPLTDKNDFEMPFLMEVDDAADALVKGLNDSGFEITFPKTFTFMMKKITSLPYWAYFRVVKKGIGK